MSKKKIVRLKYLKMNQTFRFTDENVLRRVLRQNKGTIWCPIEDEPVDATTDKDIYSADSEMTVELIEKLPSEKGDLVGDPDLVRLKHLQVGQMFRITDEDVIRKVFESDGHEMWCPVEGENKGKAMGEDLYSADSNMTVELIKDADIQLSEETIEDIQREFMSNRATLLIREFYVFRNAFDDNIEFMNDVDVERIGRRLVDEVKDLGKHCRAACNRENAISFSFDEL